jgi:hypothetical protein
VFSSEKNEYSCLFHTINITRLPAAIAAMQQTATTTLSSNSLVYWDPQIYLEEYPPSHETLNVSQSSSQEAIPQNESSSIDVTMQVVPPPVSAVVAEKKAVLKKSVSRELTSPGPYDDL